MKMLWENYLDDSTVVADNENPLYPVANVTHNFLEKKFMAGSSTKVTITMPETRTVSMIAYGYNNITTSNGSIRIVKGASDAVRIVKGATDAIRIAIGSKYILKDSLGVQVASGVLNVGGDVNINYIDPVDCLTVELFFSAPTSVFIGGIAIGDPLVFEYIGNAPEMQNAIRDSYSQTLGGQVFGRKVLSLKNWDIDLPLITDEKRKEIADMIIENGSTKTFFADMYEDNHTLESPMFCHISDFSGFRRRTHKNEFATSFTLSEAR